MKGKRKIELELYQRKWFKLICLFAFFGWLFYIINSPLEIDKKELIELSVTVENQWESGGTRNPIKLYFKTKEYSNRFGINVGGVFGKWEKVTNALEENNVVLIRIHKNDTIYLNKPKEVIPIYYLGSYKTGIAFDEDKFKEGGRNSSNRSLLFFFILFVIGLWRVLSE